MGAVHQVDKGIALLHHGGHALFLGHAAAHADHQIGPDLFQLLQPDHVAQRLVLRVFAHATGVEEDQVCLLAHGFTGHAHLFQHARDGFRIPLVHLAAHGHDVIAVGAFVHSLHKPHKFPLALHLLFGDDRSILHCCFLVFILWDSVGK